MLEKAKAILKRFEHAKGNQDHEGALLAINHLLELDPNNSGYLKEKYLVSRTLNIQLDIGFARKLCWYRSTDEGCFYFLAQKYNAQNDKYNTVIALAYSLSVEENDQVRELFEKVLEELGFTSLAIYIMKTNRIGHLACEPDSWLRQRGQNNNIDSKKLSLFICNGEICNLAFFEVLKRYITIVESDFFHRLHRTRPELLSDEFYRKMPYDLMSVYYARRNEQKIQKGISGVMYKNMSDIYAKSSQVVELTHDEKVNATKHLNQLGLDSMTKLVCLHVRDSEYLTQKSKKNFSYHDYRDADINNYLPAINYLIGQGYTVIRIGTVSNQHLDIESPGYIDLPRITSVKELTYPVDVFLLSQCCFFIGTTSGPSSLAAVFDTPTLSINSAPICHHYGAKSRSIFKHIKRKGETLNFIRIAQGMTLSDMSETKIIDCFDFKEISDNELVYVENTPEDILEAVIEFEALVKSDEIDNVDSEYQKQYIDQLGHMGGLLAGNAIPTISFLQKYKKLFNLT